MLQSMRLVKRYQYKYSEYCRCSLCMEYGLKMLLNGAPSPESIFFLSFHFYGAHEQGERERESAAATTPLYRTRNT